MKKIILAISIFVTNTSFGQFWSPTGAVGTSGGSYLIAATSIDDNIYAVGNNSVFVHSSDQGENWTAPAITPPPGNYVSLTACNNYLYASMKINNFDFELHYSTNNGLTWVRDTIGLPQNIVNSGKASMNVCYMGNNYVMAFDNSKAVYKMLGTTNWIPTTIDFVIVDIKAMNDNWFAIGSQKLLKSTDHGTSWSEIATSGLPNNFQGYKLASNGLNRLFISNAPAAGGEDIYLSTDGGTTWELTNSADNYSYSNPWLGYMFAVDDYLIAAVLPEQFNFNDAPPFLISSASTPNFMVGDVSGLPTGQTNAILPFFFNSGGKLFTMFWDLYVSEPGFVGEPVSSIDEKDALIVNVYPNPAKDLIYVNGDSGITIERIEIYSLLGQSMLVQEELNESVDVSIFPRGCYVMKLISGNSIVSKRVILD